MENKAILVIYDKISALMGLMAQAAEKNDWDALAGLGSQCAAYMDSLRTSDRNDDLTDDEMEYKMQVIRKILDDDKRIRDFAEPWMKELSKLINASGTARKVNQAYGLR